MRQAHPLLLFLGLWGVWVYPQRGITRFYGVSLLGLALLAGWGEIWKPQFQLVRSGIPLFYLAAIPAGLWVERIMARGEPVWIPVRALSAALMVMAVMNVGRLYGNEGRAPYVTMPEEVERLVEWIRDHTTDAGRILFAGASVHGYGGGPRGLSSGSWRDVK